MQVTQAQAVDERPERRLDRGPQTRHRIGHAAEVEPAARRTELDLLRQGSVEILGGEIRRLKDAVHERAERHAHGHPAEREGSASSAGVPLRDGTGVGASGSSWRLGSSGSLVTSGSCAAEVMSL